MRVRTTLPAAMRIQTGALALALAASALTAAHTPGLTPSSRLHTTPAAVTTRPLTAARASARAETTGRSVIADAMTTPTAQTVANPDGTFTMTTSPAPVRTRKNGAWIPLDATLVRNSDGTYSPTASTGALTLSGGGNGPLAVLDLGGRQLTVTLPTTLPTPTVTGDSATYGSILPDTDLVVTATAQGGYSDVFVVKSAAAAANPALSTLMKAGIGATGLALATDSAGELTATDPGGATIFNAPTATAWDSSTSAPASSVPAARAAVASPTPSPTPTGVDPVSGQPLTSSVDGPGEHAHTASLNAAYNAGTLTLTPPTSLLTGSGTAYPVYLGPSVGPAVSAWTMVNSAFVDQSYYGVGTNGHMQVGDNGNLEGCAPCFTARSYTTLDLSGVPAGAVVSDAQVHFWEDVSASCSPRYVDLYVSGPIYPGPNPLPTTWNRQPSKGALIGSDNVAKGYNGCSAGGVGFGIKQQVIDALNGGGNSLTLRLEAHDESDEYAWKQFNGNVPGETPTNASVTYDLYPSKPTKLHTSPSTSCTYNTPGDTVGDTGMTLYAPVSSPVGNNLTTAFTLYKYGDTSQTNLLTPANNIPSNQSQGPSGQPAVMPLPESFLKTLAAGKAISLSWIAQSSDGTLASPVSDPCTFTWDPTRPGNPAVGPTPTSQLPTDGSVIDCPLAPAPSGTTIPPIGKTCGFTVSPPNGSTISGYLYQLNDGAPTTIPIPPGSDLTKPVNFTLILPSLVNTLTVSALSAGGNVGSSITVWFDGATLNPAARDGDLNHDGTPDLIIPGQSGSAFPPGLWLATGHADGTTAANAINIGTAGLWSTTPTASSPGEWAGSQAITGDFCGNGAQDVLAYFPGTYNPSSNPHGAGGAIVCSNANSSPLDVTDPIQGNQHDITQGTLVDSGNNGASQVANAGDITAKGTTDPDLLATIGTSLYLFPAENPGAYTTDFTAQGQPTCTNSCANLTQQKTPDGTQDWNQWTIASSQDTRNGNAAIDLYLWNPTTGALYLWAGLGLDKPLPGATQLTKASYTLHTGTGTDVWPPNTTASQRSGLILRAADINHDGLPDLWTTGPSTDPSTATVTGYLPTSLGGDVNATTATTTVNTANHAWLFQDINANTAGSPLSTSADSSGSLTLTGTTGAVWNTGDLYSPDALLNTNADMTPNTSGTGQLYTSGPAVIFDTNHDFTIAARVRASALGGSVLSQDGANTAGLTLTADKSSGDWQFCMAQADAASPARDCATGPAVQLGLWTALTATCNHATGVMTLYVNGADTAMVSHTPASGFTGPFRIGAQRTNSTTLSAYYSGQIADVHTWNQVAPPAQPQSNGSAFVPVTPVRIMDTRHGTGGTTGPIAANTTVSLQITGSGGAISATGVTAVALTITDTAATDTGHLTVYADGTAQPNTSAVNFPAGTTVTNGAIVPVGPDGKIDIYNEINTGTGSSQILADLTGYFTTNSTASNASTYTPAGPVRILDTRTSGSPVGAGTALAVTVAGAHSIPTGITAVAVNLTAANEATGGYLTAYADGTSTPADTTVTFAAGQAIGTMSIIPVNSTDGKIDVYNASGGTTDVIADVVGYFTPGTAGQKYHPLDATRLFDTRLNNNPLTAFEARPVPQSVISAVNPTLVINLTATQEAGGGNLSVRPDNVAYTTPSTTSLVYNTSGSIANLDLAATANNYFSVLNYSSTTTQLIIDTNGYFAAY